MKHISTVALAVLVSILSASCANTTGPANNSGNSNANASAASAKSLIQELAAIEQRTHDALRAKDVAYIEALTTDNLIVYSMGKVSDRQGAIDQWRNLPCDIRSMVVGEPELVEMSGEMAMLTYRTKADGTCDGKPMPTESWSATLFVKQDGKWKVAYHQDVPARDPNAANPSPAEAVPEKAAAGGDEAKPVSDAMLTDLMSREKSYWEAFKNHDSKVFETGLIADFVVMSPTGRARKADMINQVLDKSCTVRSFEIMPLRVAMAAAGIGVYLYSAEEKLDCGGKVSTINSGHTTVARMSGNEWKAVLHFEAD